MDSIAKSRSNPPFGGASFHSRVGKAPQKQISKPAKSWGFPLPGVQSPTAAMVMTKDYFIDQSKWESILDDGAYDYIVVGSGCTALAFIEQTLQVDPHKRILCLERGELRYCHGSCPFFGGRSTFWSAWCPQPKVEDMRDFPSTMLDATKEPVFWTEAIELFHVTGADKIGDPIYSGLQKEIDKRLTLPLPHIPTADFSEAAQLAVGRGSPTSTLRFNKFSTPAPLLKIYEDQQEKAKRNEGAPLDIMLNCVVQKLGGLNDDTRVHTIETSRGMISWQGDSTQVILCAGAFPTATILQNSVPDSNTTIGNRVAGHFLTHIVARVPIDNFEPWSPVKDEDGKPKRLEIAAHYLSGKHGQNKQQYHVQITAIHSPDPKNDAEDAARECPDYAAAATFSQLEHSTNHVVFVCASLGEFNENNKNNWFKHDSTNPDITTNSKLQYTLAESDRDLWDTMDEATYQTIEQMSTSGSTTTSSNLEYWRTNEDGTSGYWSKERPEKQDIRIPGIVHETSTAYMGPENEGGSIDENYRPHGIENVYVTGGAIFPTAGSWNPTLTMCGFAQHLARKLNGYSSNQT